MSWASAGRPAASARPRPASAHPINFRFIASVLSSTARNGPAFPLLGPRREVLEHLAALPGVGEPGAGAVVGEVELPVPDPLALLVIDVQVAPARAQGPVPGRQERQVALEVPGDLLAEPGHVG